ncbi:MAG: hypothetical protein RLZZ565_81 [Planctomycetota bacterium]|jgi:hypothetical protein
MSRSRGRRIIARATLLIAIGVVGACAAPPSSESPESVSPEAPPSRPTDPRPGLVVERLRIRGEPGLLEAAMATLPEVSDPSPEFDRWRREGFLIQVIDEATLAEFESMLAPRFIVSRTWHGEATGWRSAARARLARGAVVLLDGRARPVDDCILSLGVRGWSLPLVDGAGLQAEVVPYLQETTIDPLAPPPPPGEFRGRPLTPAIDRVLAPNEILLIAAVADRRTRGPEAEDTAAADPVEGGTDAPDSSSGTAKGPGMGMKAALPPTLAGILVDEAVAGERGVLLIRGRPHPGLGLPE